MMCSLALPSGFLLSLCFLRHVFLGLACSLITCALQRLVEIFTIAGNLRYLIASKRKLNLHSFFKKPPRHLAASHVILHEILTCRGERTDGKGCGDRTTRIVANPVCMHQTQDSHCKRYHIIELIDVSSDRNHAKDLFSP